MSSVGFYDPLAALMGETGGDTRSMLQVVCFTIGEESYGIDIRQVREIRAWSATTSLPNTPEFVIGVINLRGTIVPILDLRARFGRGQSEPTKAHVVVIVAIEERVIGMLVDAVSDIVTVPEDEIRPVPEIGGSDAAECLNGLATVNDQLIALVSVERITAPITVH